MLSHLGYILTSLLIYSECAKGILHQRILAKRIVQEGLTSVNAHWRVGMPSSCLPSKARKANRQVCIVLCVSLSRIAYKFASLDSCYKRFGDSGGPLKMGEAGSCETL
jgi:hypothetical protein